MRTLTVGEAALFNQPGQSSWMRARLRESATSSTYYDLSNLEGEDFQIGVTVQESQDERFARARLTLKREIARFSVAPLVTTSKLNQYGAGVLMKAGRECVVEMAHVAPGTVPSSGDWREVFRGELIEPKWGSEAVSVEALDLGHRLQRLFLEEEREYGANDGSVGAETVIQQLIDDGHGQPYEVGKAYAVGDRVHKTGARNARWYEVTTAGTAGAEPGAWTTTIGGTNTSGATFTCRGVIPTLDCPTSPLFAVKRYKQSREPVFDAIQRIADMFAWDLRYRYSAAGSLSLKLFDPDRTKTAIDFTWYPDSLGGTVPAYLDVRDISLGWQDVRNVVQVVYSDPLDLDSAGVPKRKKVTRRDLASIAAYERRFMQLAEDAASLINTQAEAERFADGPLADLKDPKLSHEVELPLFYAVQLGDLNRFKSNRVHYSADQDLAVVEIEHTQTAGDAGKTTVRCRGKPVAHVTEWLRIESRPGGASPAPFVGPDAPAGVVASKVVGGLAVTFDKSSARYEEHELHISTSTGFTPSSATYRQRTVTDRFEVADLASGTTYFAKVVGRDGAGNLSSPSAEVTISAGYVVPSTMQPVVDFGSMVPNSDFEAQTNPSAPPDRWEALGTAVWGTTHDLVTSPVMAGNKAMRLRTGYASGQTLYSDWFVVKEGDDLSIEVNAACNELTSLKVGTLRVQYYTAQSLFSTTTPFDLDINGTGGASTFARFAEQSVVPAGAKFARLHIYRETSGDDDLVIDSVVVTRLTSALKATEILTPPAGFTIVDSTRSEVWRSPTGIVTLEINAASGGGAFVVGATIWTLNAQYRPKRRQVGLFASSTGLVEVIVNTSGTVVWNRNLVGAAPAWFRGTMAWNLSEA